MIYRIGCIVVAAALAALVLSGGGRAEAANPIIAAKLFPYGHTVSITTIDLTVGGVVRGNILGGVDNATPMRTGTMTVPQLPDDASFTYTCDAGPSTTFTIPTPTLVLGAKYKLTCPSPGGTITASSPTAPGAGDALLIIAASVGGVAEVPSGGSPPHSAAATGGSGLAAGAWAGILGAIIVGVAVLGGGALYLRKRA
ncbi:MAG: hypothetical protein KGK07_06630 [Chloroflexota bacterium]|nr:hypothetical protein [Chloroflexota bacterium]